MARLDGQTTPTTAAPTTAPGTRTLAAVTVGVTLALLLVPWLLATVSPARPGLVGPGTEEQLPATDPAVRFTAPAGWTETDAPEIAGRPFRYAQGHASLQVYAAREVRDPDVYAQRQARLVGALYGVTGTPDGTAHGPDGSTGPRWRMTAPDGRQGELLVLARPGGSAASLLVLGPPGERVDVAPVVSSLRVES